MACNERRRTVNKTSHKIFSRRTKVSIPDSQNPLAAQALAGKLAKLSGDLDVNTFGFQVLPGLMDRLRNDKKLLNELTQLAMDRNVSKDHRVAVLSLCFDAVGPLRRHGLDAAFPSFFHWMRRLACKTSLPVEVRAMATQVLVHERCDESLQVLRKILNDSKPLLPVKCAAANVLQTWNDQGTSLPKRIITDFLCSVRDNPMNVMRSSEMIRLFSSLRPKTLSLLTKHLRNSEDLARVLGAAGPRMPVGLIASLIRKAMDTSDARVEWTLRGLLIDNPKLFTRLFKSGHECEYLYSVSLLPYLCGKSEFLRVRKLTRSSKVYIARRANSLASFMTNVRQLGISRVGQTQRPSVVPQAKYSNPNKRKTRSHQQMVSKEFSTGFHLGDALYRGLLLQGYIEPLEAFFRSIKIRLPAEDHWHAAMFLGFSGHEDGRGCLIGIQSGGNVERDTIKFLTVYGYFRNPTANLATVMKKLLEDFLIKFAEGKKNHPFHGARNVPATHGIVREQAAVTAAGLFGKGITWTFVKMLGSRSTDWKGTIDDIHTIRCDGMVEYCYEKTGIRVCGGKKRKLWNIASPGQKYLENHNEFHWSESNPGELCPRIQAGDHGDGTTFKTSQVKPPVIEEFYAIPSKSVIRILFRVASSLYYAVFARLIVRKGKGPFYFVRTDDPLETGRNPTGPWILMKVPVSRTHDTVAHWYGKTVNGPDYRRVRGTYEFRLVVVDGGGNVSATQSARVEVRPL